MKRKGKHNIEPQRSPDEGNTLCKIAFAVISEGPIFLIWIIFNPNMDK